MRGVPMLVRFGLHISFYFMAIAYLTILSNLSINYIIVLERNWIILSCWKSNSALFKNHQFWVNIVFIFPFLLTFTIIKRNYCPIVKNRTDMFGKQFYTHWVPTMSYYNIHFPFSKKLKPIRCFPLTIRTYIVVHILWRIT